MLELEEYLEEHPEATESDYDDYVQEKYDDMREYSREEYL